MIINLIPTYTDWPLPEVIYSKDALTINGKLFDFGPVPEGAILPHGAIDSEWFSGEVTRVDGEIHLSMKLPYFVLPASKAVAFPEPIRVIRAGAVKLPFDESTEAEKVYVAPTEEVIDDN